MSSRSPAQPRTPQLAAFARELAEPSRATMLIALMDGRAWTVGELAQQAGVARNTASEHVRRLVRAGMVAETRQGRHCYLTLAGPETAAAIEAMSLASATEAPAASLRSQRADDELVAGRTCYRHLAGQLGVQLLESWVARGLVTDTWLLTDDGRDWFAGLGVDPHPDRRRVLLRGCIDWTVRRPHAAGTLAERFTATAFDRGWIERGHHRRSVRLTPIGAAALQRDHNHLATQQAVACPGTEPGSDPRRAD